MEGTTIGAYKIVRKLGEGGMGTVYLAEHALLGRPAALKVLLPMYSANQEVVTRFFNEARAVTRVSDPGIVQLFDFGFHTDGSAYLVMELLEGESLDARLRRVGKLQPLEAVRMIRQCASSLANAHARGIIHRDLKPENLFVVGDPAVTGGERIKILDFGVAKLSGDGIATSKTRTGTVMGTPIYMSPEQCRGASVDPRSDVYSLGCVLFSLLAGRPPFDFDNAGELIAAHLREPPPSLAHVIPAELDAIVRTCLAKSPADRYSTMSSLVEALDVVAATLWYAEPARTPVHLSATMILLPAATTLRGANGEVAAVRASRQWWRALLVAAAVAAGGLFVMVRASHERVAMTQAPALDHVVLSDARAQSATVAIDAAVVRDAVIDAVAVTPVEAEPIPVVPSEPPPHPSSVRPHDRPHAPHPQRAAPADEEPRAPAAGSGSGSAVDRTD